MTDLTESVARAIYEAEDTWDGMQDPGSSTNGPWDKFPKHWKDQYRFMARAAILETLRQIREPGEGMRDVCLKAWQRVGGDPRQSVAVHEYTEDTVWQAMIDHLIAEIGDD